MTVQIRPDEIIAGLSGLEIRRFFRHVKGWHNDSFGAEWMKEYLKLSDSKAAAVIRSLISEGYVVRNGKVDGETMFKFTDLGCALVRASGASRIARETAEKAVRDFMLRVKAVNDSPSFLYEVSDVVVFGSYLTDASDLGDVDIAVRLRSRITDSEQRVAREIEHAHKSGRSFARFIDELSWAQDEVMLALKARRRAVSIQPWYSFVGMEKKDDFRYKVIMGDADTIAEDLQDREGRRKAASAPPTSGSRIG